MTQEALKLALEALQDNVIGKSGRMPKTHEAINAIREALAQPEQEPVAWVDPATLYQLKIGLEGVHLVYETEMVNSLPLYDKPQRTWVGLTDEEMLEAIKPLYANPFLAHNALEVSRDEYQAIEAKLKEKNT